MKIRLLLVLLFLFKIGFAIEMPKESNVILVKVKADYSIQDVKKINLSSFEIEIISANMHIYKVSREKPWSDKEISLLKQDPALEIVQRNRKIPIVPRATTPNDTFFSKQKFHNYTNFPGLTVPFGINTVNAWDFNKSITTKKGDTIVVAVIDESLDSAHEDLDYFINRNEIPNDSIDNDNNGAIDDYMGWSADNNNGSFWNGIFHGTKVAGVLGAKGNNIKGIAGVAWHVKILPIAGFSGIDKVIKAYDFVITQKKNYKNSNGNKGAYIVATNFSGSVIGFEIDEPIWCSIYDSLGKYGILNIAATDNVVRDISIGSGDLPANCTSDYLLTATNLDNLNKLSTGYSKCHIDIAANASNVFSTSHNNSYIDAGSGSSFAAPMVAGTIALIYSNLCTNILDSIDKNPLVYLKKLKNELLVNVDSLSELNDKIVSSGKLNVYKSIKNIANCSFSITKAYTCKKDSSALNILTNKNKTFSFVENQYLTIKIENNKPISIQLFDMWGRLVMQDEMNTIESRYDLTNLTKGIYILSIENDNERENKKIEIY
jgi:serine protease